MHTHAHHGDGLIATLLLGTVMMVAMMAPAAAARLFGLVAALRRRAPGRGPLALSALFLLGYLSVWSAFGALGVGPSAYGPLVGLLLGLGVGLSVGLVVALSVRRRDVVTAVASGAGGALVLLGRLALDTPAVTATGAVVLVGAALVNAVRCRRAHETAA